MRDIREIVVLTGRDDEPPQLPEWAWVAPPLAAIGEVTMWFLAGMPAEVFERTLRVAVATATGERVEPFGEVDAPRRVIYAVPRADLESLSAIGALAEMIRQRERWTNEPEMLGIINLPTLEHLTALEDVAARCLPSVVFIFQPTLIAPTEDDAVELTEWMQDFAKRHETAVVLCLWSSEEFIQSLEES